MTTADNHHGDTPAPTPSEELARKVIDGATSSVLGRLVLDGVVVDACVAALVADVVRGAFAWLSSRAEQGDAREELTHALIAAVAVDESVGHYELGGPQ